MNKEKAICQKALNTYGAEPQITMVFEEMAELQKELCKYLRGKDNVNEIAEEIADTEIMLEQMKILFGIRYKVEGHKTQKLERLEQRMATKQG